MKVLLVDDDNMTLEILSFALQQMGHDCMPFNNPVAAWEASKDHHYDAMITDYRMDPMDGLDLMKRISSVDEETKVILMTGYPELMLQDEVQGAGAYAYMEKPLSLHALIHTLDEIALMKNLKPYLKF